MTEEEIFSKRWWTLGVLCLSLLIVFIGNSSLNVVIPTLSEKLHASTSELQWAVASYSLVFAGMLFVAGALGDRFGRKGALQFGLLGLTVASVLAAFSKDMGQIIAMRALMGGCAAFIMPSTLSILVNVFPPHERARAISIWAGVAGSAGALGPIASGWMLGHFWYGSVFLVNVPVVLLAFVLGYFLVPKSKDPNESSLDPVGAGLSIVGLSTLVFALIQAPEDGWLSAATLGAFALGAIVIAAFVWWEKRVDEPMLDMDYFKNPAFSVGTGGMILVFMSMFGVMFLFTQYFQLILGFSPLGAALRFLPIAPIMMIVSPNTPKLIAKFGHNRTVAMGMSSLAVGFLLFSTIGVHTPYPLLVFFFVFVIGGIALTQSPMTAAIMSAVPPERAGAGSAMNDSTRELGSALGVAVLGSVAASQFSSQLKPALAALNPADRAAAGSSLGGALQTAQHLSGDAAGRLVSAAQHAFIDGVHTAAYMGAALAVFAAVAVLKLLPRRIDQHGHVTTPVEAIEETFVGVDERVLNP
jgi:EmrB/QacA subfamily drug resistance transporter